MLDVNVAWINGMPRSGTTWASQIFASSPNVRLKSCPLFSYEFKNALDETSSPEAWNKLFTDVYCTNSEFLNQDHLRKYGLIPDFKKESSPQNLIIKSNRFHHLTPRILELVPHIKFIHIVRHPCATLYSWLSNEREFPVQANPLNEWRSGQCRKTGVGEFWGFDDWKLVTQQALSLTRQFPNRHKLIRYEDLVANTVLHAKALFEFLGIPFGEQTQEFIALSQTKHDDHKHSVFKNPHLKVDWKEKLDPMIISTCMNELANTELEQFTK